ncbi:MAG: peptidoglycan DD-metalloendopeptidase family protein [Weeksellaceae bacterium]|nr:peptidoglycan DD-metalloendopeptidase family protein [Weeksellaceae bacterium]
MTKRSFLVILCCFAGVLLWAQPSQKERLRQQSQELRNQISALNKVLNENRAGSQKSLLYIKSLEEKIKAQDQLVSNANREKRFLDDEIYLAQLEINHLNREMAELKKEYKEVLVNAYKNKSMQNKVVFVLGSKNFTEAYRRLKYLEKYSNFQGEKAEEIKVKQAEIEKTIAVREAAKKEKEMLLARQQAMRDNLEIERREQNQILADYRKNASNIASDLRQKQQQTDRIQSQIQAIIQEEIRIAREREEAERRQREEAARLERERLARVEAERREREAREARERELAAASSGRTTPAPAPRPAEPAPTPLPAAAAPAPTPSPAASEATALSSSFAANQGSLPWPTASGQVVGRFGRNPHPVLPQVMENNPGVKIATSRGSMARSVFGGTVTSIMTPQPGMFAIVINHGDYFTVYNNLESVNVTKGQKVGIRDNLGRIFTDSENNTILDFQIYKGMTKLNPASWVTGM